MNKQKEIDLLRLGLYEIALDAMRECYCISKDLKRKNEFECYNRIANYAIRQLVYIEKRKELENKNEQ